MSGSVRRSVLGCCARLLQPAPKVPRPTHTSAPALPAPLAPPALPALPAPPAPPARHLFASVSIPCWPSDSPHGAGQQRGRLYIKVPPLACLLAPTNHLQEVESRGSSPAATAGAHQEDHNLLHAGSSCSQVPPYCLTSSTSSPPFSSPTPLHHLVSSSPSGASPSPRPSTPSRPPTGQTVKITSFAS